MIEALRWLYATIPFMQLMGTRANILGFIWFLFLIAVTLRHLSRNKYVLGVKKKYLQYLGLLGVTVLTLWVFHRVMDVSLALISWSLNIPLVGNFTPYFWFAECFDVTMIFVASHYLFNVLKLKQFFKARYVSGAIFLLIIIFQLWVVSNFSIDYAGLEGAERIRVFWSYYPAMYCYYAALYLSFLKNKIVRGSQ